MTNAIKVELAHDILARKVYDKASTDDKMILKIENLIRENHQRYLERKVLLNEEDLEYIAPFLNTVNITKEEEKFIQKSQDTLRIKQRNRNIIIFLIILLLALFATFANYQALQATEAKVKAQKANIALEKNNEALNKLNKDLDQSLIEVADQKKKIEGQILELELKNDKIQLEKKKADRERKKAQKAAQKARLATIEAKAQRDSAFIAQQIANSERDRANALADNLEIQIDSVQAARLRAELATKNLRVEQDKNTKLNNINVARVNANLATRKLQEGKLQEGLKLAVKSYQLNKDSDGPTQNADIYEALQTSVEQLQRELRVNLNPEQASILEKIHDAPIRAITTTNIKNEDIFAFATEDKYLCISKYQKEHAKLKERIRSLNFNKSGKYLLAGTVSGDLKLWELENQNYEERRITFSEKDQDFFDNSKGIISHISFATASNGKEYIAIANKSDLLILKIKNTPKSDRTRVRYYEKEIQLEIVTSISITNPTAVAYSEDGKYIMVASQKKIWLYNIQYDHNGSEVYMKLGTDAVEAPNIVTAIAIGSDDNGHQFAFGFKNGLVRITEPNKLNCISASDAFDCTFKAAPEHKTSITKLAFGKDSKQLISSSLDKTAKIWNLENFDEERISLIGHDKWVWDIIYNSAFTEIYTVSEDKTIRKWGISNDQLAEKIKELQKEYKKINPLGGNSFPKGLEILNDKN